MQSTVIRATSVLSTVIILLDGSAFLVQGRASGDRQQQEPCFSVLKYSTTRSTNIFERLVGLQDILSVLTPAYRSTRSAFCPDDAPSSEPRPGKGQCQQVPIQ